MEPRERTKEIIDGNFPLLGTLEVFYEKLIDQIETLIAEREKEAVREFIKYIYLDHVTNPNGEFDEGRDYVIDLLHERIRLYKENYLDQESK